MVRRLLQNYAIFIFPITVFFISLFFFEANLSAQVRSGPSSECHVSDGEFTICPDGGNEWSDVPFAHFENSNSYLYADQADFNPNVQSVHPVSDEVSQLDTFMLLYDECNRTSPLQPDEYFLVNFDTVETENGIEKLERYSVHIFTDGTIIFFKNGVLQKNEAGDFRLTEIDGQRGKVGFGPSPTCQFDHVIAEYQIILETAGGNSYSPDPLFWGGTLEEEPDEQDLPPCPEAGQISPVRLNRVDAPGSRFKPFQIIYDDLDLEFTSEGQGSGSCKVSSNQGDLNVLFDPVGPIEPFKIATSRAEVEIEFTEGDLDTSEIPTCDFSQVNNNCFINANPGGTGTVAKWSTSGFEIQSEQIPFINRSTGPLEYYVSVEDFNSTGSFNDLMQTTEQFIHETLINDLSGIDRVAAIQDPPADLLVTNPNGLKTGLNQLGQILTEIPASGYFTINDWAAVIILNPEGGLYTTQVIGQDFSEFSLSMSVVDLTGNVRIPFVLEEQHEGVISPSGTIFTFEIPEEGIRPGFRAIRPGFDGNILPGNDDGSTGLVPLGFTVNFFGTDYNGLFINNNGNLTLDAPLSAFTPFDLTSTIRAIIAPFFADVDTRVGNVLIYGTGTVDGNPAFGATWPGVGCFSSNTNVLNYFQVLLVNRPDTGQGNFDIEFNYDSIEWDSGQASGGNQICQGGSSARVGYSNGTGDPGTFFELPGSGIPGAFLNSNPSTGLIQNSLNSSMSGKYIFPVRNGIPNPVSKDKDDDGIENDLDNCPNTINPDQLDTDLNGIGDACQAPTSLHTTAGFLQAWLDGTTTAEPTSLFIRDEPEIIERLIRIVNFRTIAGLTTSPNQLIQNLVNGLVEIGLVETESAQEVIDEVMDATNSGANLGDLDNNGCIDRDDYNILIADIRNGEPNDPAHDLNEDGVVNRSDARTLVGLFTNPRGAPCN